MRVRFQNNIFLLLGLLDQIKLFKIANEIIEIIYKEGYNTSWPTLFMVKQKHLF